mgnify:CR=1 FL=1
MNDSEFLARLKKAITAWMKNTSAGELALEYSSDDFNIGDLSSHLEDGELEDCMKAEGILKFDITIHHCDEGNPIWIYDTHLFNNSELEDNPENA